jgi:formylglycine-generating enzyme required for sulfatase activity
MKMFEKNNMKKILIQLVFFVFCISTKAQKVSNIRAEQRGQEIVVLYSLEATSTCEVSLLLSQDNGSTWSAPLKNISGDVGKNISGGEKQIIWKVLEEKEYLVGDKMKFKVIANGKKSFEPEMVFVEGGTFKMGSDLGDFTAKPVHKVTISSFKIGIYEVTQAQWRAVMSSDPSYFKFCDQCPVESVSWVDIQEFITKLNAQTKKNYRLPTEAEWEYAAKGSLNRKSENQNEANNFTDIAWYAENSGKRTHIVGSKECNEFGIYDMSGNVWEWCSDYIRVYSDSNEVNPKGESSGLYRVLRGGGWGDSIDRLHATYRMGSEPNVKQFYIGFRLVLPADN